MLSGDRSMSDLLEISKKIVLLGDPAVGKTSLIRKYVHDIFDDKYISTLGTKVSSKVLNVFHPKKEATVELKFMIWDVMGQKDYEMFHQSAYSGSQGALIVCDITRRDTLNSLPEWVNSLFDVTTQIPIILLANKNDLVAQKQFEFKDVADVASTFDSPLYFTSAKTGENIEDAFSKLGQEILKSDSEN
jgi:small GTP-binding protein